MINRAEMTRDEISLLLYMETCLVDNRGRLASIKMNEADFTNMNHWKAIGFIDAGRLPGREVFELDNPRPTVNIRDTHWVKFTNEAWSLVQELRRERAERHIETLQPG